MSDLSCADFGEVASELALGLLTGDERAGALEHLGDCQACRHHLQGLLPVADALVLLAPPVEPSIGFESRLMARLNREGAFSPPPAAAATTAGPGHPEPGPPTGITAPPPTHAAPAGPPPGRQRPSRTGARRRWAVPVGLVAAAALVVAAGLAGVRAGRTSATTEQTAAAQKVARSVIVWADHGRSTCRLVAFVHHGQERAWLVIQLDEPGERIGSYQVLAEPAAGGPAVVVGTLTVTDGLGILAAAVPAGTGMVNAVRVVEPTTHKVRYRAPFAPV